MKINNTNRAKTLSNVQLKSSPVTKAFVPILETELKVFN